MMHDSLRVLDAPPTDERAQEKAWMIDYRYILRRLERRATGCGPLVPLPRLHLPSLLPLLSNH